MEITWPVVCLSQGHFSPSDLDHWGESNVLGVSSGAFNNMEIVDSTGNVFLVKEITTVPKITSFDRFFSFIINRNVKVEIVQYEFKSKISLADFKTLLCKTIDREELETGIWSEIDEPEELKNEILNCCGFEEIIRLPFMLPAYKDKEEPHSNTAGTIVLTALVLLIVLDFWLFFHFHNASRTMYLIAAAIGGSVAYIVKKNKRTTLDKERSELAIYIGWVANALFCVSTLFGILTYF